MIRRKAAAGDDTMHVRMVHQILAPGMQDRNEADVSAEVFRIGGNSLQRVCGGVEQNVVDDGLVLVRDCRNLFRNSKHHVEIRYGQQIGPTVIEPFCSRERLALRTVPVSARVVGDALMPAGIALLEVATKHLGATLLDRAHHPTLGTVERAGVCLPVCLTIAAKDVRHF